AGPTIRELAEASVLGATSPRPIGAFELLDAAARDTLAGEIEDAYPATALQAGMLVHYDDDCHEGLYHNVIGLHLELPFDEAALYDATARVIESHPTLRTSFDLISATVPLQLVHRAAQTPIQIVDWRNVANEELPARLSDWIEQTHRLRFDLSHPPLIRIDAIRLTDSTMQLVIASHHAILDGWSLATLLTEVFACYASALGAG